MRGSMRDFDPRLYRKIGYPGLPEELEEYSYYLSDSGYCLMCIPECFEEEAWPGSQDGYELALPTRYVLEKGYRIRDGYLVVDVPYSDEMGAMVPDGYDEF